MSFVNRFATVTRAFQTRNYRLYASGNLLSLVGNWMQRLAVGWLTWQLTESGTWLGIIAVAQLFPTVLIGPLAGTVADRFDRLRLIKISQTLALVQASVLALLVYTGGITIELLLLLTVLLGAFNAFNQPARHSLIPSLVGPDDLSAAIAINSIVFNIARFIGPAIAGIVIITFGVAAAFAANAASFLIFLFALSLIHLPARAAAGREYRGLIADVGEGYAYAIGHPGIGPVLVLLFVVTLCARPYVELMPGFAADVFHRGADGLAWLTAAAGLGALVAGVWLAQRGTVVGLTRVLVSNFLLIAIALLAFTATGFFVVAVPAVFVTGFALTVNGISMQTLVQNTVDPTMRGRVLGLYGMVMGGGPALGALGMGALSESVGLRLPLAGGALICALAWVWAVRRRRALATNLEGSRA